MRVIVTGGAGFIGQALTRELAQAGHEVVVLDALTYAANPATAVELETLGGVRLARLDVCDGAGVAALLDEVRPDAIAHLAAETHVDRSIDVPAAFVRTNVVGTQTLLHAALDHWRGLDGAAREAFRFVHVSTDEVFGSLGPEGRFSTETPYDPRSPYSASKAASDHMARAYGHTYGLPVIVTNCSNNYGPYQFPEKLIPLMILKGLSGEALPVYGDGLNVRDWLYVGDHAAGLKAAIERGRPGETYLFGGDCERTNLDLVRAICARLDAARPDSAPHERLIRFVADRPGHDRRYAVDASRARERLGWRPRVDLEAGLNQTVDWYLSRRDWWGPIVEGTYALDRLGAA